MMSPICSHNGTGEIISCSPLQQQQCQPAESLSRRMQHSAAACPGGGRDRQAQCCRHANRRQGPPACAVPLRASFSCGARPAALSRGGRCCRLPAWRQVPRVARRACRHGWGGLFWQYIRQVVIFVNSVRQVVLLDKNSNFAGRTFISLPPAHLLLALPRAIIASDQIELLAIMDHVDFLHPRAILAEQAQA